MNKGNSGFPQSVLVTGEMEETIGEDDVVLIVVVVVESNEKSCSWYWIGLFIATFLSYIQNYDAVMTLPVQIGTSQYSHCVSILFTKHQGDMSKSGFLQ